MRGSPGPCPIAWLLTTLALAPAPARGAETRLYGGIEIGAKGVKAVAVPITQDGRPDLPNIVRKVNNVTLGDREPDGKFRSKALDDVRVVVSEFYLFLTRELKIPPARVYVVSSSSLLATGEPRANVEALRQAVAEATGGNEELLRIDQETEVDLLIRGAIPREHWHDAVLIDVGSGTVKCGYFHPKRDLHVARIYFVSTVIKGTVAYTKMIQEKLAKDGVRGFANFCNTADQLRKPEVVDKVAADADREPGLKNRARIYLSGGAPWAIVTLTNPEGAVQTGELYVRVSLDKIRKFRDDLQQTGRVRLPDLNRLPEATRSQAEEQIREVLDTFTKENLLAGCEVLLGFAEALEWLDPNKEVYFTRSGVDAWIVGYVDRAKQAAVK